MNATLYADNQKQHPIGQSLAPLSFSLDDITGDVDHIQSNLDNIRELIFDKLPDGTSIEDFFGEDLELISPLLQSVVNNDEASNLLLQAIKEQKPMASDFDVYTGKQNQG